MCNECKNAQAAGSNFGKGLVIGAIAAVMAWGLIEKAQSAEHAKPTTRLVEPLSPYPTEQAAAMAALSQLIAAAPKVEYGGVIYECFGQFFASVAVTQNLPHDVDYLAQNYNDCRITATYHIHPSDAWQAEYFSERDLKTLKDLKVTGYLGVVASKTVRKQPYNGRTEVVQFGSQKIRVSLGEELPQ